MSETEFSASPKKENDETNAIVLGLSPMQWSVLSSIITVVSSAGIIIAIVGVALAYREQVSNEQFRQIKESLEIISQWEEQSLSYEFDALEKEFDDLYSKYGDSITSKVILENFLQGGFRVYTSKNQGLAKFKRVDRYFNRLGFCVKSSLCDESLILDYFEFEFARWANFTRIAERSMDYKYGSGTKYLLEIFDIDSTSPIL